ncbi:MAG: FAD-dependent oxidoreductase [Chromatiales bacterium]|nr:FAD-dependent oxidoreductase [Chromatiales bacterium]
MPDLHYRPGHFLHLHKRMRQAAAGIPVIALGRIGTPHLADEVIATGQGDLVGASRAQIADAAFANKAADGRSDDIRPSTFNNFCWGEVHAGKPLAEFHNPELATEGEAHAKPKVTQNLKRVAIIGAGPAGLEAAWVAAARGHQVTLYGASKRAGGKLALEALLPGHASMDQVTAFQMHQARQYGVEFKLGQMMDEGAIKALVADVLILATGAIPRVPQITLDDSIALYSVHGIALALSANNLPKGHTAVVFDHDHTAPTYAAALALTGCFQRVIVATPRTHIAQAVNYCSALGIHRRLDEAEVEVLTGIEPISGNNKQLHLRHVFSRRTRVIDEVSTLVYSTPRQVVAAHLADVRSDVDIHLIGDCMAPRNLYIAMHEGHALGASL